MMGGQAGQRLYRKTYPDKPYVGSSVGNMGTRAHELACEDAELGSAVLKQRIEDAFGRFGEQFGITADEARLLLLDTGVRLPPKHDRIP